MRAVGIDVGVRKGLDLVLLDGDRRILGSERRIPVEDLGEAVERFAPEVVAIDAPPTWARSGRSRRTERELRWFGIQCFNTPSDARMGEHPFYEWMTVGFRVFEAIADRFPRYRGSGKVAGRAIEVFPHASAVVLAGCLPPRGEALHGWRREVLRTQGVEARPLRSPDLVDAALAALTGLFALERRFSAPGDPREGQIVVPTSALPAHPYRRAHARARVDHQPTLPGLAPCACGEPGCTALTAREFARGHDAKRKSLLWATARAGTEAIEELRRRGWDLPIEAR